MGWRFVGVGQGTHDARQQRVAVARSTRSTGHCPGVRGAGASGGNLRGQVKARKRRMIVRSVCIWGLSRGWARRDLESVRRGHSIVATTRVEQS